MLPQDPRAYSWSPWLRTSGACNKILVQWLSTNSALRSKILQLKICTRSLIHFTPQTPSTNSLPNEILWSTFTWMILLLEMSSLSSLQWAFLLRLPRYFLGQLSLIEPPALIPLSWGIMTPNVWRWPPATLEVFEDATTCLFVLHPVSSTNLTSNTLFNSSPKLLSPLLFI